MGRGQAAQRMRDFPFSRAHSTYSIGISAELLAEMSRRISSRGEEGGR